MDILLAEGVTVGLTKKPSEAFLMLVKDIIVIDEGILEGSPKNGSDSDSELIFSASLINECLS